MDRANQRIQAEKKSCSMRYSLANGRHMRQIRGYQVIRMVQTRCTGISQRRADGVLNSAEQSIREEILPACCPKNRSGADQYSHAHADGDHRERYICWSRVIMRSTV